MLRLAVLMLSVLLISACATKPQPRTTSNICEIFKENPSWYRSAKRSVAKRGGNLHVPMAIIYQESSFKAKARPPMNYFLGFIPIGRASNAYGYAQALKSTWAEYERDAGSKWRSRDNFGDAFDFVLWYMNNSQQRNSVSKWDAYAHYLNYHEGQGGYARGSYHSKIWLVNTAKKVDARAKHYAAQLSGCRAHLDSLKRRWF